MPNKKLFVILTVPHAVCLKDGIAECDEVAFENAVKLSKAFNKKHIQIEHVMLVGNVLRQITDLNRIESAKLPFHKQLNQLLIKENRKLLVLDIHSGYFGDNDFILLVQKKYPKNQSTLIPKIISATKGKIKRGRLENFIVEKALRKNIPALLFEFNESLNYVQTFHDRIARAIKSWDKMNTPY